MVVREIEVTKYIDEMIEFSSIESVEFYKGRIKNFFEDFIGEESNKDKPLNAITFFDVDRFLNGVSNESERSNHYYALKRFFRFTYLKGYTNEIMERVKAPIVTSRSERNEPLDDQSYNRLKAFIVNEENDLNDRLILGLFLFTGLSRKYITSIISDDFRYEDGVYKLIVWKNEQEIKLPLKAELQILVYKYCENKTSEEMLNKVVEINENYLSTYIGNLTNKILGRNVTPTSLSATFIKKALQHDNNIWEVSRLTLEEVTTTAKHIINDDLVELKLTSIINSF